LVDELSIRLRVRQADGVAELVREDAGEARDRGLDRHPVGDRSPMSEKFPARTAWNDEVGTAFHWLMA